MSVRNTPNTVTERRNFWIVFLLVYVSNDTLLFGTNKDGLFFILQIAALLLLFFYILLCVPKKPLTNNQIAIIGTLSVISILSMLFNNDLVIKYPYEIFVFILSVFVVNVIPFKSFANAYKKVMTILAVTSIALFLVFELAYPVVSKFPHILNDNDLKYYFFGLGFLEDLKATTVPRSYGIFREPGVYMIFLVLALLFELFYTSKIDYRRLGIYLVALILTFSTAAYIVTAMALSVLLFGSLSSRKRVFGLLALVLLVFAVFIAVFGWERISGMVFGKLDTSNSSKDSRFSSFMANINIAKTNLFCGRGWTYAEDNFQEYAKVTEFQKGGHNTNTLLKMLAVHGLIYFGIIIVQLYRFWRKISSSKIMGIFLTGIWFIALSNEDLIVNTVIYLIIFYGMSNIEKVTNNENSNNQRSPLRKHI